MTELGGWEAVRAAAFHHEQSERMTVRAAFAAHTRGGWRAAGIDDAGVLAPGTAATFAIWESDADLVVQTPDSARRGLVDGPARGRARAAGPERGRRAHCLRTAVGGRVVYEAEGWSLVTRAVKKLDLDPVTVRKARSLARKAGRPVVDLAR